MTEKESLIAQAKEKNLELTGNETVKQLKEMLGGNEPSNGNSQNPEQGVDASNVNKKFDGEANPHRPKQKGGDDDEAFTGTVANVRSQLKGEDTRRVMIPLTPGEPKGTMERVGVNGYFVNVRKGEYVDVPATIASIIEASQQQTSEALTSPLSTETGNHLNLDQAPSDVKDALTY